MKQAGIAFDVIAQVTGLSIGMNKELFEAAEIAKFNPKELGEYWESLKNFRNWYSVMSTQLKKGREEGLKEGLEKGLGQGRKEECFKNAKK